jgi:hypothetical protein
MVKLPTPFCLRCADIRNLVEEGRRAQACKLAAEHLRAGAPHRECQASRLICSTLRSSASARARHSLDRGTGSKSPKDLMSYAHPKNIGLPSIRRRRSLDARRAPLKTLAGLCAKRELKISLTSL